VRCAQRGTVPTAPSQEIGLQTCIRLKSASVARSVVGWVDDVRGPTLSHLSGPTDKSSSSPQSESISLQVRNGGVRLLDESVRSVMLSGGVWNSALSSSSLIAVLTVPAMAAQRVNNKRRQRAGEAPAQMRASRRRALHMTPVSNASTSFGALSRSSIRARWSRLLTYCSHAGSRSSGTVGNSDEGNPSP